MSDGFEFFIDDVEIKDQPNGWEDFEEAWEFDEQIFGLIPSLPVKLEFDGDGYQILKKRIDSGNYCEQLDFRVDEICNEQRVDGVVKGKILLPAARFDLKKCIVDVEIEDDLYGAKIKQNKKIEASVETGKSKNNTNVTGVTSIDLTVFNPVTGTTVGIINSPGTPRTAYDVGEVLRFLVEFMTDGEVGFVSNWYDDLPSTEKLCLATGKEIRTGTTGLFAVEISFEQIMNFLHGKYNLYFTLEDTVANGKRLRLEELSFYRDQLNTVQFIEPPELTLAFETDRLYSRMEVGSKEFKRDELGNFSLPYVPFLTHTVEDFVITGECNSDNTLDLIGELVYCNNVFQDVLVNNNNDFDDDTLVFQYTPTGAGTGDATQGFYLTEPTVLPALYNEQLLNTNVSARFDLAGEVAKYFGDDPDGDKFRAQRTTDGTVFIDTTDPGQISTEILSPFQDDSTPPNFDTNGNWDNVLFRYTAPSSGFYNFRVGFLWRIFLTTPGNNFPGNTDSEQFKEVELIVTFRRRNAAAAILQTFNSPPQTETSANPAPGKEYTLDFNRGIFLAATDYIEVTAEFITSATATALGVPPEIRYGAVRNSFVLTQYIATGGGIFEAKEAELYFVGVLELEDNIDGDAWDKITANPALGFRVICGGVEDTAFIRKISRKSDGGDLEAVLIKNFED